MKHRYGRFKIDYDLLKSDELMAKLLPIFGRFVPQHIDNRYDMRIIVYYGYSPDFELIDQCVTAPLYEVTVHEKTQQVFFKRLKEETY